jgi:uncharacterized protein (DUF433 family)
MSNWDWEAFIRQGPGGELFCGHTPVLVRDVVADADAGMTREAMLRKYPALRAIHVMAALTWAAEQEKTAVEPDPSGAA